MKREITFYIILTVAIISLLVFQANIFQQDEEVLSRVVNIDAFEKLDINVNCNIFVNLGDEQKVVLEGSRHYLDQIETRLEDGILSIYQKDKGWLDKYFGANEQFNEDVQIYVNVTEAGQLIAPSRGCLISSESGLVETPTTIVKRQLFAPIEIINMLTKLFTCILL